jgi:hypothetical protein
MRPSKAVTVLAAVMALLAALPPAAPAGGILQAVVNSPVDFTGTVAGERTGINLILDRSLDPEVPGRSLKAGRTIKITLAREFFRNEAVKIDGDVNLIMVKGWPQGGIPVKAGYTVGQEGEHTLVIRAQADILADALADRPGIKVFHVRGGTFMNPTAPGQYPVRIEAQTGPNGEVETGEATVAIVAAPTARIAPTNFLRPQPSNNNFQRVPVSSEAPLTLDLMLWGADGKPVNGAGVVPPDRRSYPRYTGGLIVQDADGDGRLDPRVDRVIGGVIGSAPAGATGQSAVSPVGASGNPILSGTVPRAPQFGGIKDNGIMPVRFRTGSVPGEYRPTFELIGGNSVQFVIIAVPK